MKIALLGSDNTYFNKLVPILKSSTNSDVQLVPFIEPKPSINMFDKCVIVYDPSWDNIAEYRLRNQYEDLCGSRPFYLYIYITDAEAVARPSWINGALNLDTKNINDVLSIVNDISSWDPQDGDMYAL